MTPRKTSTPRQRTGEILQGWASLNHELVKAIQSDRHPVDHVVDCPLPVPADLDVAAKDLDRVLTAKSSHPRERAEDEIRAVLVGLLRISRTEEQRLKG